MSDWLDDAIARLASRARLDVTDLRLTDDERTTILALAGYAAHESGARVNAPLLCYLLGRASATGVTVEELSDALLGSDAER